MQHVKFLKSAATALIAGLGAFASANVWAQDVIAVADGINMWDGQWHFEVSPYAWVPWIYVTSQLPPIAGGGNPTTEIEPNQYLKYVKGGVLFDGSVRKGDWSVWTDLVFLNLQNSPTHEREIGLPGGSASLVVTRSIDLGFRAAIWTLAPTYTVMNNDVGTLDVLAGLRYTSVRVSLAYEFTVPAFPTIMKGGGFWPTSDSTEGIIGVKGALRLSHDGKWFAPYEADAGDGNKNWSYNGYVGAGYHFHWGDVALGVRNLTYNLSDRPILEKARLTGPILGASFRW